MKRQTALSAERVGFAVLAEGAALLCATLRFLYSATVGSPEDGGLARGSPKKPPSGQLPALQPLRKRTGSKEFPLPLNEALPEAAAQGQRSSGWLTCSLLFPPRCVACDAQALWKRQRSKWIRGKTGQLHSVCLVTSMETVPTEHKKPLLCKSPSAISHWQICTHQRPAR